MASFSVTLCDKIVASLNAANLGFTAQRKYSPFLEWQDVNELKVFVLRSQRKLELIDRGGRFKRTHKPVVVVQQKIPADTEDNRQAFTDKLSEVVEQLAEVLFNESYEIDGQAVEFISVNEEGDNDEVYYDLLRDTGRYGAILTLEYLSYK